MKHIRFVVRLFLHEKNWGGGGGGGGGGQHLRVNSCIPQADASNTQLCPHCKQTHSYSHISKSPPPLLLFFKHAARPNSQLTVVNTIWHADNRYTARCWWAGICLPASMVRRGGRSLISGPTADGRNLRRCPQILNVKGECVFSSVGPVWR